MPRITRKLEFDAGHRVLGHEGKCAALHGHRYVAEITVEALRLDTLGRVVDFGVIKTVVGKWIDDNWDHNMILNCEDPLAMVWLNKAQDHTTFSEILFGGKEPYLFLNSQNPTAEVIAEVLFNRAQELLTDVGGAQYQGEQFHSDDGGAPSEVFKPVPNLKVVNVRIFETPNCYADYSG